MKKYRLSYPALIYASVEAESLETAKAMFVDAIHNVADGMLIDLDIDQDLHPNEMLYPALDNETCLVSVEKVEVENVED